MRSSKAVGLGLLMVLAGLPALAGAQELGGYVGVGVGVPTVAYGTSSLAFKIDAGFQIHEFAIGKGGAIKLAVQGEYINFGDSTYFSNTWSQSGVAATAVGRWTIPRNWAPWADEKVVVIAKLGGATVSTSSNFGGSYTYNGLAQGIGAEYLFTNAFGVRAMIENYPGSYQVHGIAGVFHF